MKIHRVCDTCGNNWSYDGHYTENSNGARCDKCGSTLTRSITPQSKDKMKIKWQRMFEEVAQVKNTTFVRSIVSTHESMIRIEFTRDQKSWWADLTIEEAQRIGFINFDALKHYARPTSDLSLERRF